MNNDIPIGRYTIIGVCLLIAAHMGHSWFDFHFNRQTRAVFCDVGQGDGAYLRINNRVDVMIDAGPRQAILSCIGKYMPFYDRTIEIGFISHPQLDHYGGYIDILKRYHVRVLAFNIPPDPDERVTELLKLADEKGTKIIPLTQGQRIRIQDAQLTTLWPSTQVLGKYTSDVDPNDISQVIHFRQRNRTILFTGDITPKSDPSLLQQSNFKAQILKIPHHGSTNALTRELISLADPTAAVISVGAKNRYGHPSSAIVNELEKRNIRVYRTDQMKHVQFKF